MRSYGQHLLSLGFDEATGHEATGGAQCPEPAAQHAPPVGRKGPAARSDRPAKDLKGEVFAEPFARSFAGAARGRGSAQQNNGILRAKKGVGGSE